MGFQRLGYDNYETWKLRARQVLTREGLWRYIEDDLPDVKERSPEWETKNDLALQTIGILVEDAQLRLIQEAVTAKDAWNILRNYYIKDSSVGKVALIKKLSKTELSEAGDLRQHLVDLEQLFEKIENAGCRMDEDMKAAFILASLPESYENTVAAIQGRMEVFTMNFVKTKLLEEYDRRLQRNGTGESKAMVAKTERRNEFKRLCYACGSPEHLIRDCDKLEHIQEKPSRGAAKSIRTQTARSAHHDVESDRQVCFAALQEENEEHWYLDSAASTHMTGNGKILDWHTKTTSLANGNVLHSVAEGGLILSANGPNRRPVDVKLNNVVVVPGLSMNLVSVEVITRQGYEVIFNSEECKIMKYGGVVIVGQKVGKLYRLNM